MQNHHLVSVVAQLLAGRLYSLADRQSWQFNLPVTTLDQIVGIGPTHDLIGHPRDGDGRGAFTFDAIKPDDVPIYPALWAAKSKSQKTLTVAPTHNGHPVAGRDKLQTRMLNQRSNLFVAKNFRMTSQAMAAAMTTSPAMGGNAWAALLSENDAVKAALSIWLNSTLGLALFTCYAHITQPGRALMKIKALEGFPVPDFAADSDAGARARATAARRWAELAGLELEPASYAFRDAHRHRIDAAALELLGLDGHPAAANAVARLRELWCREPSVHGGNQQLMAALSLTPPPAG